MQECMRCKQRTGLRACPQWVKPTTYSFKEIVGCVCEGCFIEYERGDDEKKTGDDG